MCGTGAQFQAGGDAEEYSGAFERGIKEQSGEVDGGGWLALSSEDCVLGGFLGKSECFELGFRGQIRQILGGCAYEQSWDVQGVIPIFSTIFRVRPDF
jgi:hypothetical protein